MFLKSKLKRRLLAVFIVVAMLSAIIPPVSVFANDTYTVTFDSNGVKR